MGWRDTKDSIRNLGFLDSEDIEILKDKYDFTVERGLYARFLNHDLEDYVRDGETTLQGFLNCLNSSTLKKYARVTITATGVAVEYENDWRSLEGSCYEKVDSKEELDCILDKLFSEYE